MQNTIQKIHDLLSGIYPDNEIMNLSRLVIEHVTGYSIPVLLSDKSKKITPAQEQIIHKITQRLQTSEPIQYILGKTEFYGLPFIVNENVLIPRPETEELVELIINENQRSAPTIIDIGTGSGCIAVALKKWLPDAAVCAWDFSETALSVAKKNADLNQIDITFEQIDVLRDPIPNIKPDVIVSNPPYVLSSEKENMNKNVLDYEPHSALFVPDDNSLLFYIRIADIALQLLNPGGKLYLEINRLKGQATKEMLKEKGFDNVKVFKDMSGNDRMVTAQITQTR